MQLDLSFPDRIYGPEHLLAWSLLLLRAAAKAGLTPLPTHAFHRLHYFSNCLAIIYDSEPPIELVLKHPRGPFYPRAQVDLDKLSVMGLVDLSDVSWERTESGVFRTANHNLNIKGFELSTKIVKDLKWGKETADFLLDLCNAYSEVDEETHSKAFECDLGYSQAGKKQGAVIPFNTWATNLSARGVSAFDQLFPSITPNRQHKLRLYMRYLEARAA
jgi:hypothetical protein